MLETIAFANALEEVTLVLFTTFAPGGVVCIMVMACLIIGARSAAKQKLIERFLYAPIAITLFGLVASATHLGSPGNALYAFTGIGRSPLSNEIAAGVVFLGIAGLYWMTSFSQKNNGEGGGASQYNAEDATSQSGTKHASSSVNNPLRMRKIAAVLMILSGVAFLFFISRAYSTETIISWNNSIISLTPILYALMIGPLLTVAVMFAADRYAVKNVQGDIKLEVVASKEICVGLFVVSIVFFVLSATAFVLQYLALGQISNSIGSAYERIPQFIYLLCVFVLLCVIALAIEAHCVFKNSHSPQVMSIAYLIMSAGIFVMRFAFYMSYTTVGISL